MNLTCNSTLEELRIGSTSEIPIAGPLTFHQLAIIIAAASTLIASLFSFYLIMRHATHYTKPHEQKHIIRILFMVPVYAVSSTLALIFYWHAIYYEVISDCYEAFAIASFFGLLCSYIEKDIKHVKIEMRKMEGTVKPWVWPLNWFKKCCGGERGPWRTPRSFLTWFNIVWVGVYQYCFIRVAMTITAVVTQHYDRYCESSNSPVFAHIWVIAIECISVTIAMFCLIQFYVQFRDEPRIAPNSPFLKVLAIKLVIFLSFWQSSAISVGTSTLNIVKPNAVLAYPDLTVGIPSLLLTFEMACFAILHLWAFPWRKPYWPNDGMGDDFSDGGKKQLHKQGGTLGLRALGQAMNPWDLVKAFGRGMRWLFVGVKKRHIDDHTAYSRSSSIKRADTNEEMDDLSRINTTNTTKSQRVHLPIAESFSRSNTQESAGLIAHAQENPTDLDPYRSPYQSQFRDTSPYRASPAVQNVRTGPAPYFEPYSSQYAAPDSRSQTAYMSHQASSQPSDPSDPRMHVQQALWKQRDDIGEAR